MKYLTGLAWVIAILTVGAVAAHWTQIKWYLANKATVDAAADAADALKQTGVLK